MKVIDSIENCEDSIKKSQKLFNDQKYIELLDTYKSIIEFKSHFLRQSEYGKDVYKFHSNISFIYYLLRDFENALKNAKICIDLCPQWYKSYYRAAKALEGLLDAPGAEEYYSIMNKYDVPKNEKTDFFNLNVNILKEWLINNGADLNNTKIEYYDVDYRGMCVDKPIKINENIMQIPSKCIISLEDCKSRGTNKILMDLGAKYDSPHTPLALELLDIKYNPESEFKYYIQCLPKYFDNVPINFCEEKLRNLEGSFTLVKIAQKKHFLRAEYTHILSLMPNFVYTYQDFVWAKTCVITRVYGVERNINNIAVKDTILVPFADMANHVMTPNTHWFFDKSKNSFVVNATKYLSAGDDLFESYGKKNNYRYFVNYGFTVENNAHEEVAIVMDSMTQSAISKKLYLENYSVLNYINTAREIFQIGYNRESEQFKRMIQFATDKCSEILKLKDVSPSNEYIYNFISGFMRRTLEGFDTTLEEDIQMLRSFDLGFDIKNCLVQRIGEKKLLHHYINYFSDLLKLKDIKSPKEQKKFMKKMDKKFKNAI